MLSTSNLCNVSFPRAGGQDMAHLAAVSCCMVQLQQELPRQHLASLPAGEGIAVMGQQEHEVIIRLPGDLHVDRCTEAPQQARDWTLWNICEGE